MKDHSSSAAVQSPDRAAGARATHASSAHLGALVRAQLRAASEEADRRGERLDYLVSGEPRPVWADAERVSRAIGGILASAMRFSEPGARLWAGIDYGRAEAVVTIGIEGDSARSLELSGVLDESLAEARTILEENDGSLLIRGRRLSASLPLARA
jgi:hypothetical protein